MPEKGKGIPNLISAPLGFLYLIGMIEQERPGKDAYQILDLRLSTVDFSNAITHLDNFVPDMVAISSFSREAPAAVQFVSEVKKKYPRTTILLGGPYVTSEKQAVFRSDAVDFAIQSEGEVPFIEFLEYLEGKCRADEIQNLIYRENGQARMNPVRP